MSGIRSVACTPRVELREGWQFATAAAGSTPEQRQDWNWQPASVPGTAASALRDAGQWTWDDPRTLDAEDFWWRLHLVESGAATLGFDGIATLADVWLDGNHLLGSDNMFVAHRVAVELNGDHELLIRCRALAPELAIRRPRPRWRVPMLREQQLRWFRTSLLGRTPGWSPPCPPIGPWRPVWIEKGAPTVGEPTLDIGVEGDNGIVDVVLESGDGIESAILIFERDEQRVVSGLERHDGRWLGRLIVNDPVLWWPHTHGEPALYRAWLELVVAGVAVRLDLGQRGFRTIRIDRDAGDFRIMVNGVDVFCRGACWTPLDAVSLNAPAEAYESAVDQVRDAGMNMLRVAGPTVYEADAFYEAMDRAGILLWQDLMFANMDYPEDPGFVAGVVAEVEQQLARLKPHACLALVCGNSEGEQQAAMGSAPRERWSPALFHETLAALVEARGIAYTPSSAHGGAFPHAANCGASSYYGVGAYLRPLEDARRAEVRFASECLAFANIPEESGLPGGPAARVHHPAWKARSPRDLGAGWDFDDVRDHYVQRLFGIDPAALRVSDHERYVALGQFASGEVMARVFSEWRRARSLTRGGLIWFLRDLWPGAGWGVIDAEGRPKPCYYVLRRALAPVAISISDEGVNGLAIHVVNDRGARLEARVELSLFREGRIAVGRGSADVEVDAHTAIELAATDVLDGFFDLSFAYRFGPPMADVIHVALVQRADGAPIADAFFHPLGHAVTRGATPGLAAEVIAASATGPAVLQVGSDAFAQAVRIEVAGFRPSDNYFDLAPGQQRLIELHALPTRRAGSARGSLTALNSTTTARFEVA